MLVNSVIIVLREVLEAALMIGILLAVARHVPTGRRWLLVAFVLALGGAVAYARNLATVSAMFGGVGQELLNAGMHLGVFAALVVVVFHIARRHGDVGERSRVLPAAMAVAVALAVAQEGSEVFIYVSGFLQVEEFASGVTLGSIAGAGIGFSVGVLFYYALVGQPEGRARWIAVILLAFAAANMCIQATNLLIQADWLPSAAPLWDSSALLPEDSLVGQLLYALVGYEATPSALEAGTYGIGFAFILLAAFAGWWLFPIEEAHA
jgi:high-affinity iron transporter